MQSLLSQNTPQCRRCERLFDRFDGFGIRKWRLCGRCVLIMTAIIGLGVAALSLLVMIFDRLFPPKLTVVMVNATATSPQSVPVQRRSKVATRETTSAGIGPSTGTDPRLSTSEEVPAKPEVASVGLTEGKAEDSGYGVVAPGRGISKKQSATRPRDQAQFVSEETGAVVAPAPPFVPSSVPTGIVKRPDPPSDTSNSSPRVQAIPAKEDQIVPPKEDQTVPPVVIETVVTPRSNPTIKRHAAPLHPLFTPAVPVPMRAVVAGRCIVLLVLISETGDVSRVAVQNEGELEPFLINRAVANAKRPWRPAETEDGTQVAEPVTVCYCWPASDRAPAPHCP